MGFDQNNQSPAPLDYANPGTDRRASKELSIISLLCSGLFLLIIYLTIDNAWARLPAVILLLGSFVFALDARRRDRAAGRRPGAFPTASLGLAVIETLLACALVVHVVTLPPLGRSRETANRVKCGSNLRQIGEAIRHYANDNGGRFPPDFDALMITQDVTFELLICASSTDEKAKGPTTQAALQRRHTQPGHCSYIYVGAGLSTTTITPAHVLAYEPLANHRGDGINVLFGDGHVEFLNRRETAYLLAELNGGHNPPRQQASPSAPSN